MLAVHAAGLSAADPLSGLAVAQLDLPQAPSGARLPERVDAVGAAT